MSLFSIAVIWSLERVIYSRARSLQAASWAITRARFPRLILPSTVLFMRARNGRYLELEIYMAGVESTP